MTSTAPDLPLLAKGKVREMYDLGDDLLMVASDRISTYDVVHPTPIPDKGRVLTGLSVLWFDLTGSIVPNHFVSATDGVPEDLRGRALRVQRLEMLPVECVVRGYITGSGWKDYQRTGTVSGLQLPEGLRESDQLPEPLYTPSTKAEVGHDEAIDFEQTVELIGDRALAERVRDVSLAVYGAIADHARERGVILADTKLEFGLDPAGDAGPRRRGLHAGLLALLARRRVRARPRPGRPSTSSTCATGPPAPAGTRRRRRRRSRTTWSPPRASAT